MKTKPSKRDLLDSKIFFINNYFRLHGLDLKVSYDYSSALGGYRLLCFDSSTRSVRFLNDLPRVQVTTFALLLDTLYNTLILLAISLGLPSQPDCSDKPYELPF